MPGYSGRAYCQGAAAGCLQSDVPNPGQDGVQVATERVIQKWNTFMEDHRLLLACCTKAVVDSLWYCLKAIIISRIEQERTRRSVTARGALRGRGEDETRSPACAASALSLCFEPRSSARAGITTGPGPELLLPALAGTHLVWRTSPATILLTLSKWQSPR